MSVTNSPNMRLPVPTVGNEPGPTYAFNINSCMSFIDTHDHSEGKGVQVKTAGLFIDQDLDFHGNAAMDLSAVTLLTQTSPPPIQSIFVKAAGTFPVINELWYIDSASRQVQLTSNGIVNVTASSITGVSYSSGTFFFTQAQDSLPTTPASLSAGNVILKPIVAGTPYSTTLKPNSGLASNNSIVMPALPGSNLPLSIDNSGNMSAAQIPTAQIADLAVTDAKIASQTITPDKAAVSASTVVFSGSPYTILPTDLMVFYNATGGPMITVLPTPVGIDGRVIRLKKIDSTTNGVTINTAAGSVIDSSVITPLLNTPGEEWEVTSDGTNWQVTNHKTRTPPVAYVPGVSNFTVSSSNLLTWREGKFLYCVGLFATSASTGGTGLLQVGFNGLSGNVLIDQSLMGLSSLVIGYYLGSHSTGNIQGAMLYVNNNTSVGFGNSELVFPTNGANVATPGNAVSGPGEYCTVEFKVPIVGWLP